MEKNAARRPWWRNWKRIVAVWLSAGLIAGGTGILWFNNCEATRLAVASATSNPELIARLGQPMRSGWWITGGIEITPGSDTRS